jgi:tRNA G18 (ribose-2'-O)-methylase SpoU
MTIHPVADPDDPRLYPYRHLSDAELLREHGLFVAEGRFVVERVLADRRYLVDSLLLNAASVEALRPSLVARGVDLVFECPAAAFERITGINIHRGCLAMVRRLPALTWQEAAADARVLLVLEAVTNADNVGGVFRNAAAFGADAVLLSPTCCDPLYRKAIRTSAGASLRVRFGRLEPWPQALGRLRDAGFTLVALSPRQSSSTLDQFVRAHGADRIALLVGTEGPGLSAAAMDMADLRVRVPIRADVDSLNLAVATGIALSRIVACP